MRLAAAIVPILFFTSTLMAEVKTKSIEYKVGDTVCEGFLAYDDAGPSTKRPGVIVVQEWWGLNDYPKMRAQQLAKLGYVAFCADMYGKGKTTTDAKQAQAWMTEVTKNPEVIKARFEAAMQQLKQQPNVDLNRIAAMGYCFGGGVVLNAARGGAELKGVVSFHGSLEGASKAKKGDVKAKILVCHGAADTFESPESVEAFKKEMDDAGADWQMNIYAHAVHSFTNPNSDKVGIKGIGYNAEADRRSWQAMKSFFEEIFETPRK